MALRPLLGVLAVWIAGCTTSGDGSDAPRSAVGAPLTGCVEPAASVRGACIVRGSTILTTPTTEAGGYPELLFLVSSLDSDRFKLDLTIPWPANTVGPVTFDLSSADGEDPSSFQIDDPRRAGVNLTETLDALPSPCLGVGTRSNAGREPSSCTTNVRSYSSASGELTCERTGDDLACRLHDVRFKGDPGTAINGWIHGPAEAPPPPPPPDLGCDLSDALGPPPESIVGTWVQRSAITFYHCTRPESEVLAFDFHADGTVDGSWCGNELEGVGYDSVVLYCGIPPLTRGRGTYVYDGTTLTIAIDNAPWLKPTRVMKTKSGIALDLVRYGTLGFVPASTLP